MTAKGVVRDVFGGEVPHNRAIGGSQRYTNMTHRYRRSARLGARPAEGGVAILPACVNAMLPTTTQQSAETARPTNKSAQGALGMSSRAGQRQGVVMIESRAPPRGTMSAGS